MDKELFKVKMLKIMRERVEVYNEDHMFSIINTAVPHINIEIHKGDYHDGWGDVLPFDYGEFPDYINPADDMGWDIIIAPDSRWNQPGLKVAGIVRYKDGSRKEGNDKIILAFNGNTTPEDKETITNFFSERDEFLAPEFYDTRSENKQDDEASTTSGWEAAFFKQYKLTRVRDDDWVGMGVGRVGRKHFHGTYDQEEDRRR